MKLKTKARFLLLLNIVTLTLLKVMTLMITLCIILISEKVKV